MLYIINNNDQTSNNWLYRLYQKFFTCPKSKTNKSIPTAPYSLTVPPAISKVHNCYSYVKFQSKSLLTESFLNLYPNVISKCINMHPWHKSYISFINKHTKKIKGVYNQNSAHTQQEEIN